MEMKKTLCFLAAMLAIVSGCVKYEFNTEFQMPAELVSPAPVTLDVTSSETVVLSWNGGGASDGGIVLYNVMFDKVGGDFSNPIAVMQSDLGANPTLTLSHATLNTLARKAGIAPNQSGSLIWTVSGAKGGETRIYDGYSELKVTRGEGIDNIPEHLYIKGTAALEAGQEFRVAEEGLYIIYTEAGAGSLYLTSEKDGGFSFYADASGKLSEGDGTYDLAEAPSTGLVRITVNFNTLAFTVEEVGKNVRAIWGATYADIAVLEYVGNGEFVGDGDVVFYGPGREGTPDWCSWVEERYYFIAQVNGSEVCWGSTFGSGAWTPDGTEEFFYVVENPWEQWNNLWKMDHAYDNCHVTFTISTNRNNQMTHSYTGGAISYDQPASAPAELYLNGDAAEAQAQPMHKVADGKFVIYNRLSAGNINFSDENGVKYFAKDDNDLYIGAPKTAVEASEGVTRITVDFNTNKVSYDAIDATVYLKWAATYYDVVTLTYQGLGKYAGEGDILFLGPGREGTPDWCSWAEERYYFILKVNGTDTCWGRLDGVDDQNRPDGGQADNYFNIGEFAWDQWSHCWKMASALDESTATVTIDTNNMSHSFVKQTSDPVVPSIAPEDLSLSGSGAEAEGQPFRKVSDGVFQIVTKLGDGEVSFKSGRKNYFADAEMGLWEGDGTYATAADGNLATRITVDFVNATVKFESISYIKCIFGCSYYEIMNFNYSGNGTFSGEGRISFVQPGDPEYGIATWLTWTEERYYYIATIDGADVCWGRLDGADGENRPDNPDTVAENFWQIGEFGWSQWDHLWKFASNLDQSDASIVINTNDNGFMTQTITKK